MRIHTPLTALIGLALLATACTVKDVDLPALSGPSTFAQQILLSATRDTLTQNGVDSTDIVVTATGPDGQALSIPLRAQIFVSNVAQDFGTLSTKSFTTPATIRYTAPAASTLAAGQVPTTVTLMVTPEKNGDFRSETSRQLDIRLLPQGIILPTNPNLAAAFTISPAAPKVLDIVTFDASTTTNSGTACATACTYAWDFGDGTSGSGQVTTHQYRTVATFAASLTVTDARGATAVKTTGITVAVGTPPTTVDFTMSPSNPGVNQTIFFNASASRAATGRTLVSYDWDFGKGTSGTGVTVTKTYAEPGTYTITLKVTDDAAAFASTTKTLVVGSDASKPTARLTSSPAAPTTATTVFFDGSASTPASAPIVSYQFTWGDNTTDTTGTSATATHRFTVAGVYVVRLTVTDSEGRTGTITINVTVT
jgi:PKD repeat protein